MANDFYSKQTISPIQAGSQSENFLFSGYLRHRFSGVKANLKRKPLAEQVKMGLQQATTISVVLFAAATFILWIPKIVVASSEYNFMFENLSTKW